MINEKDKKVENDELGGENEKNVHEKIFFKTHKTGLGVG